MGVWLGTVESRTWLAPGSTIRPSGRHFLTLFGLVVENVLVGRRDGNGLTCGSIEG
jgi:hypothetical protein